MATSDPVERDRALSEWKVKFNGQIISLKEFLAMVGSVEGDLADGDEGEEVEYSDEGAYIDMEDQQQQV